MSNQDKRIPVSVITGFLGSGKTTLLNRLVRHPGMGETAVIVNEFGEIGLDHELIESSDENTILLGSGCLCCTVRGDLVDTLGDLSIRRLKKEIPPFQRVVIETTGLADPAPILHTLMSVPVVSRYRLDTVITTVDVVNGIDTLKKHQEAVKQAAIADRLIITKTDLSNALAVKRLVLALRELNPSAPATTVVNGEIDPDNLFDSLAFDLDTKSEDVRDWLKAENFDHQADTHHHSHDVNRHNDKVAAFCLTFDKPMNWRIVALWLDSLAANQGEKLLRVKGIVNVEDAEEPIVIHAVQHLFHPPMKIQSWPEGDRQTRIVFITSDLSRAEVEGALEKAKAVVKLQSNA